MNNLYIVLIIFGGLILLLVIIGMFAAGAYNSLVRLRNLTVNAFAQIDVQLQRRHDLIPNLVETAKAYMKHERETLEAVISARNTAASARQQAADDPTNPNNIRRSAEAEGSLSGAMTRFFALSESYPDLKADKTIASLSGELTTTENQIASSRQSYNDTVLQYNNTREVFPTIIFASIFNFQPGAFFQIEDVQARKAPKVSFG